MGRYGNIGRALSSPPESDPDLSQLRASLSDNEELKALWDWLARTHPQIEKDADAYLNEYVIYMEFGR